jgi:uncharacterized membrane protein YfcA
LASPAADHAGQTGGPPAAPRADDPESLSWAALPKVLLAGTVVGAINSAMALGLRAGSLDIHWGDALPFLVLAIVGTVLGKRIADRVPASKLTTGFVVLLIALAAYTAISSISQLL